MFRANLILLSVSLSLIVSQLIKFLILKSKKSPYAFESLYREYGGMPSSHTAVVSAIVFSVYFLEGFSNLFYVSLIFSLIIIVDVIDSKWFYERRDRALNELMKKHKDSSKENLKQIKGNFGHTCLEVFVGVLIAFLVTYFLQVF